MRRYTCAAVAVLLVVFPWRQTSAGDQVAYTLESLPTSASIDNSVPAETGINASGEISGYVTDSLGNTRAVRYTDGTGWEYVPGLTSGSKAWGINSHGDIVGTRLVSVGTPPVYHAFRYNAATGVIDDILPLTGGVNVAGLGINDDGDVVGQSDVGNNAQRGFIARPGQAAVVLPTLGGTSDSACGINNLGQIALTTASPKYYGLPDAARIEADDQTVLDAGTVDGTFGMSVACAIDDLGHIGGFSSADSFASLHAYRWDPGHPVFADAPLPSSNGNVESIAAGVSAGWYTSTVDGHTYAMIYTDANGAVDLNTQIEPNSGWVLTQIKGINASGQMVGDGWLNGARGVFRLTPVAQKDTTPPVIQSVTLTPSTISVVNGQMDSVAVAVSATDDSGQPPSCQLSSISGPGVNGVDSVVTGTSSGSVKAVGGRTYTFNVTCSDAAGNSSTGSATVTVPADVTPPVISGLTANPSTIWPPALQMVTVTIAVAATDDSGVVSCSLANVAGPGTPGVDYLVTGQFTGSVKAYAGRTYAFTAQCVDFSGNVSSATTNVVVPPDTTPPVISSVSASPNFIWPPDNKLDPIAVAVAATDFVDPSPSCALTSIGGGQPGDSAVTGQFSGVVRAVNGAVYTLTVTCRDFYGNAASASTAVVVTKMNVSGTTPKQTLVVR